MHNNVGQELIPTTLNPLGVSTVQKPMTDEISRKLDTMIDALSPLNGLTDLALRRETIVDEVGNASVMAPCGPIRLFHLTQSDVKSSLCLGFQRKGRTGC